MKRIALFVLVLALVITGAAAAQDPIRIGLCAPLSGDAAMVGQSLVDGAMLAIDEFNAAGGIDGHLIEVYKEDDEQTPRVAANAVNKLIFEDNVVGIIGPVSSGCVLTGMEVAADGEVPMITPTGSGASITHLGNPWIARTQASDILMAGAITRYAVSDLGAKRVAVIFQSDDYGSGGGEVVKQILKDEFDMEPVAYEQFEPSALDVSAQVLNIKNADPDAIIMIMMYQQGALVARKVRELGMDTPLMGLGGLTNAKLFELGGDAVVGLANTQTFFADANKAAPASAEFITKFQAAFDGRIPDSNNAMSYDAARIMIEGLKHSYEKTGEFDTALIMEGIKSVTEMPLASGTITMDENGDANRDILIIGITENGGYELIK
ncbi:MAG: ABC transporter substrate-binding protein [Anaerolineaceae bacterium]|nr:ABC transporter substrate-binding protein [Anaerolineaceae bacterium]